MPLVGFQKDLLVTSMGLQYDKRLDKPMDSSSQLHDVIVIGIGGMGSSAIYHLARRGADVLGLEKYDLTHEMGSSHGETRIFRLVQPEGPSFVPLANRAGELWNDLQSKTSRDIFHQTGSLHAGPPENDYHRGCIQACEEQNLPYTTMSAEEANEKYPGFSLPEKYNVMVQPDGGFLVPKNCILAYSEAAMGMGAEIKAREEVLGWDPTQEGVEVNTDQGVYRAKNLVITAGAWTSKLLKEIAPPLTPERRVMGWFKPKESEYFKPDKMPVYMVDGDPFHVYGFPSYDIPGFKIGFSPKSPEEVDPDQMNREPKQSEQEKLRRAANQIFSGNVGSTLGIKTCIRTGSLDGKFYVDSHPQYPQVTIAAGFSGRGFKFCSAIGEMVTDLTLDGDSKSQVAPFTLDRV